MLIGYARVSSSDQSLDIQVEQLKLVGCEKIFQENASGKSAERDQLNALIDFSREGDTIHVMKVDRLARNTIDALQIADALATLSATDRQQATAQRFCPMMTSSRLGAMGAPIKLVVEGKPVFVCCKACVEHATHGGQETVKTAQKLSGVWSG